MGGATPVTQTRTERLAAVAAAHDEWIKTNVEKADELFDPSTYADPKSVYNQHVIDIDATGQMEDAFAKLLHDITNSETLHPVVAAKWDPIEHPRDHDGKFIEKGTPAYDAAVKAAKAKAVTKTKKTPKPLHINTNVIYKQTYTDGQVVASKPAGPVGAKSARRLVWNAKQKKFQVEMKDSAGDWVIIESYGKGAAYKQLSQETGWTEPDDDVDTDVPPQPKYPPPVVKIATPIIPPKESAQTGAIPDFDQFSWVAAKDWFDELTLTDYKKMSPEAHEYLKETALNLMNNHFSASAIDKINKFNDKIQKDAVTLPKITDPGDVSSKLDELFGPSTVTNSLKKIPSISSIGIMPNLSGFDKTQINNWFKSTTKAEYDSLNAYDQALFWDNIDAQEDQGNPDPFMWATTNGITPATAPPATSDPDIDSDADDVVVPIKVFGVTFTGGTTPDFSIMTLGEITSWYLTGLTPDIYNNATNDDKKSLGQLADTLAGFGIPEPKHKLDIAKNASTKIDPTDGKPALTINEIDDLSSEEFKKYVVSSSSIIKSQGASDFFWEQVAKHNLEAWAALTLGMKPPGYSSSSPAPATLKDLTPAAGVSNADFGQTLHTFLLDQPSIKTPSTIGVPQTGAFGADFKSVNHTQMQKIQNDMLAQAGKSGWTSTDTGAVSAYTTSEGYQTTNAVLRNDQKQLKKFSAQQLKNGAQRAIDLQGTMLPLTENLELHRGTGAHAFGFNTINVAFDKLKKLEGKTIKDRGFTSTSIVPPTGVSYDYSKKPIKVLIRAPKGTPATYVTHVTPSWSKENELILAAGTNFKIASVEPASAAEKAKYGSHVEHIVVMDVVSDEGVPAGEISTGTKVKKPSGSTVTPAPAAPTPATKPIVIKPPKGATKLTPIKLNTATIYKTDFTPGTIVAVRVGYDSIGEVQPQRLLWYGKKFLLQRPTKSGVGWVTQDTFNKKEAFAAFGKDDHWFSPAISDHTASSGVSPADIAQSLGIPINVVLNPTSNSTATLDPGPLSIDLENDIGDIPSSLTNDQLTLVFDTFKSGANVGIGAVFTSSNPEKQFKVLANLTQFLNKNFGSDQQLNYLQTIKIVDQQSAAKANTTNNHTYEKNIVAWLKTAEGKNLAPQIAANAADPIALAKIGTGTFGVTVSPSATVSAANAKSILETMKSAVDIGQPSTTAMSFPVLSIDDAAAMQKKMNQKGGGFTAAQRSAIKSYTGAGSTAINSALYGNNPTTSGAKFAVDIQSAMKPVLQSFELIRNTDSLGAQFNGYTKNDWLGLTGKKIAHPSFMGGSVGGISTFEGRKLKIIIEVPEGTPATFVRSISSHKNENELLLAAGLRYEIKSVEPNPGGMGYGYSYKIRMRVVPQ